MKKTYSVYYLAAFVALITFLVYLPSLANDFVAWDDDRYVYENPFIRSFDGAFFKWAFFDIFYAHDWIPLTWISHAADYAVWGLNPLGHHLTNNILHTVNTFLVVVLIMRLVGAASHTAGNIHSVVISDRTALIAAGVTGLLFGIHPIHVESVAWVAERRDVLYTPCFILSLMMYTKHVMTGPAGRSPASRFFGKEYLLSLGLFLLALMGKPMAVSLPVVLMVLDWYPFGRIRSVRTAWSALLEKIPFLALAIFSSVITYLAKKKTVMGLMEYVDLQTRILVATKSLVMYLWKMLFPHPLNPLYAYPGEVSVSSFEYYFPLLLVAAITITCVVVAKRKQLWLAVWAFYVITLLPVIGILQVGIQSMADRYTYVPGIGPFLVAGIVFARVMEKADALPALSRAVKSVGVLLGIALMAVLSLLTVRQIQVWQDSVTLYNHIIAKSPVGVSRAHYNRGVVFSKRGETDKAIADFEKVVRLSPGDYDAYAKLGMLYGKSGSFSQAIASFDKAIRINPDYPLSYGNRGYAYSLTGNNEKALADFNKAIALDINYVTAYVNRGNLHLASGRKGLAANDFQKACSLGHGEACSIFQRLQLQEQDER